MQLGCVLILLHVSDLFAFSDTKLNGISHVMLTVKDLEKSTKFYTEGLGGMKIDKLSTNGIHGNRLYYAMYQREIMLAAEAGRSPAEYGVCDIGEYGRHDVSEHFY